MTLTPEETAARDALAVNVMLVMGLSPHGDPFTNEVGLRLFKARLILAALARLDAENTALRAENTTIQRAWDAAFDRGVEAGANEAALTEREVDYRVALAENTELREAIRLLAPSAAKYDSRVFRIHALPEFVTQYLTEEDLIANAERPSETDHRVIAERDAALAAIEQVKAELADERRLHNAALAALAQVNALLPPLPGTYNHTHSTDRLVLKIRAAVLAGLSGASEGETL